MVVSWQLKMLELLKDIELDVRVLFAQMLQEEVGLRGWKSICRGVINFRRIELSPANSILKETNHSGELGKGTLIRIKDDNDLEACSYLEIIY